MMQRAPRAVALLALGLWTACASSGAATPRTARNTISRQEIEATNAANAVELIERLRPEFLRPRSGSGAGLTSPVIYINGVRANSMSQLQALPKEVVFEVTYIDSGDATTRFGTGHGAGAVMVSTRR